MYERVDANFSKRIKKLRFQRSFSQKEVAQRAGVTTRTIQRWEKGDRPPVTSKLLQLANAFEVSVAWITLGDGPEPPVPPVRWQPRSMDEETTEPEGMVYIALPVATLEVLAELISNRLLDKLAATNHG